MQKRCEDKVYIKSTLQIKTEKEQTSTQSLKSIKSKTIKENTF